MQAFLVRRAVGALTGSLLLGAALAGCGGGNSSPAIPAAGPQSVTQAVPAHGNAITVNSVTRANGVDGSITVPSKQSAYTYKASAPHTYAANVPGKPTAQSKVYPADLQYFGGPVMQTANIYDIYVDSGPSTFNYPKNFLSHLNESSMIHIADQYVGTTAADRYNPSGEYTLSYAAYTTLGDNDLISMLHTIGQALAPTGSSTNIYNVFLPPNLNYCGSGTVLPLGSCNASGTSPNPAFCAFHEALNFSDVGEVLFTLQPYQDLNYCSAIARSTVTKTPNGVQNDSTDSTLSHEVFETITDPIPGYGWYTPNVGVHGEIGDLCAYLGQTVDLAGHRYFIQREYSNKVHACTNTP